MSVHLAQPEHEVLYQDLIQLIARHPGLSPKEMLAVAANMVGKMLAIQDQRIPKEAHIQLVIDNMEAGNQQVIDELLHAEGGTA